MRLNSILALVVLASPAFAQQGIPLSGKDIERLSPANVVLERRKELKLEPPRVETLDSLHKAFADSANRLADDVRKFQRAITTAPPMLRRVPDGKPETREDSLDRAELERNNREKRDRYFATVTTGRRDLAAALLALKELFDASLASTIAALDGGQHTAVALSLERASEEFTRRLRLANIR